MVRETAIRTSPAIRADKFVARWHDLEKASNEAYQRGGNSAMRPAKDKMAAMAKSLERDPQLESILRNRKAELGISFETGHSLGRELCRSQGIDWARGRGLGI